MKGAEGPASLAIRGKQVQVIVSDPTLVGSENVYFKAADCTMCGDACAVR